MGELKRGKRTLMFGNNNQLIAALTAELKTQREIE